MSTTTPPDEPGKTALPPVLETARLRLRPMRAEDAEFVVRVLNDPDFLAHVGDRGVRSEEDARRYVREGPVASYERQGFGLLLVERRDSGEPIGICGLLKREVLPDADVGFAFLPRHRGQGYAFEAASAVVADARGRLCLEKVLAITSPGNTASIGLLRKLGFSFERTTALSDREPDIQVFALEGGEPGAAPGEARGTRPRPRAIELRGGLSVPAAVEQAFELFSPLGEKQWVPGWDPELLHPEGVSWAQGQLFRTREERGDAIWVVTSLDRSRHEAEYHRVEPGRYVARVRVECEARGPARTEVRVSYQYVGLSPAGNDEIGRMSATEYEEKMRRWEGWIEEHLSRR